MGLFNFWKRSRMASATTWSDVQMTGNKLLSPAYSSNGRVYTSGVTDLSTDVRQQTEVCAAKMKKVLEASGSSMDKVLKVLLFIQRREDAAVVNEVYTKHFGSAPARSCIIVDFPNANILVEFEVVATTGSLQKITWDSVNEAPMALLSPAFQSNGIIHTAGQVGYADGVMPSDVEQQTINACENVKKVLEAAGSSLSHSLKVLLFITKAEDSAVVNKVYKQYFGHKPARSCIIVQFPDPSILVELEVIAAGGSSSSTATVTTWKDLNASENSLLSPAWTHNGIVFTSGCVGADMVTNAISSDVEQQAHTCFKNVVSCLQAAGSGSDKILKVLLFIKHREHAGIINDVYAQYFTNKPGRSCIMVGFANSDYLVEAEVVAEAGSTSSKF